MIRRMSGIYSVMRRELGIIISDRNIFTIIILAPLFYALFYCTIYLNKNEENVDVIVVDMDHSRTSETIIKELDATQILNVTGVTGNLEDAKDKLYQFKAHAIIFIDKNFEKSLKTGRGADLKTLLNTTRFLVSNDINKAVTEVALTTGYKTKVKFFESAGYNINQAKEIADPLKVDLRPLFNTTDGYGDFMIPALLILIIQQTLLIGLAESMAKERENETIKELFLASNKSPWSLIFGKSLFYILLYAAYSLFFFTALFSLYTQNLKGSSFALIVLTLFFILSVTFISIFVASFFKKKILSLQFFVFLSQPIFLLSGYSWPLQSMPDWVRYLALSLPSTHYFQAFVRISTMGAGFYDVLPEIYTMIGISIIGLVLTRWRIKVLVSKEDDIQVDTVFQKISKKLKKA